MSLLELQRDFLGYLFDRPNDIPVAVRGDGEPGLAVYHNAYSAQLVACMKDSYERLWAWLGDAAFEAAARQHIAAHPPESWTLNDYGIGFADTVHDLYPYDPEVAEIAALDWALRRAFDGPDAPTLDLARLAEIDWDDAIFQFVPTLTLIPIRTNCGMIWNAIATEGDVPPAETLPEPAWVRVWRVDLQPQFATIEGSEKRALELARSGMSFGRLCNRLAEERDVAGAVESAGQYLASWIQDRIITDIG